MRTCLALPAVLSLAASLAAQLPPPLPPVPMYAPDAEISLPIPDGLGGGSARRVVRFDPDGDLLHDLAILWSSGAVTFGCMPEIMAAFADLPVQGAKGIARVPAVAMPAPVHGDGLLVATGSALSLFAYDPALAALPTEPTGLAPIAVAASLSWQQIVRAEVCRAGGTCLLLGLDADLQTVRIGALSGGAVTDLAAVAASHNVQQMLVADFVGDWSMPLVVLRTNGGLEFWTTGGLVARPSILAPTAGPIGAMTMTVDGGETKIAWVVQSSSSWLLRMVGIAGVDECAIPGHGFAPDRFRPLSIGALPFADSDTHALVLSQNVTPWQFVLTKDPNTPGAMHGVATAFPVAGLTYLADECGALLEDMNNDGDPDFTIVLTSQRCVRIRTAVAACTVCTLTNTSSDGGWDLLHGPCAMIPSNTALSNDDTLALHLQVPSEYLDLDDLEAQVVAWRQHVADPVGTVTQGEINPPYEWSPMGPALTNQLYTLPASGLAKERPILPALLVPGLPAGYVWTVQEHFYVAFRLIQRDAAGKIDWSTPVQTVAFLASDGGPSLEEQNFLNEICVQDPPPIIVHGSNRNFGVIHKPDRIAPPGANPKPPAPPLGPGVPAGGPW